MTAMQRYVMQSHWPNVEKSEFWTIPVSPERFVYLLTPEGRMTREEWDLVMRWLEITERALVERSDPVVRDMDYWLAEWNK